MLYWVNYLFCLSPDPREFETLNKINTYELLAIKTEPDTFSWNDLLRDKKAIWDGVRNFQARKNLKE